MAPAISGMLRKLTVLLLLCLAPALGAARERPDDGALLAAGGAEASRTLLQAPTDCARRVPNCAACRFQRMGTVTITVCTACSTGYIVKNSGRACWCAPGYKKSGSSCVTCGTDLVGTYAYCTGSLATWESAVSTTCGANKITSTAVAKSQAECVAAPGYGWVAGDGVAAVVCDYGSYNPGKNNRKCTKCPGGLTTTTTGATSAAACVSPAGYYYYRGKAVACAKGYYKLTAGNADCTPCPTGFTTTGLASTTAASCSVVKAGYSAPSGSAGTAVGAECAADTYRSGEAAYTGGAINCSPCPAGMKTNGVVRAVSEAMCLAPPGYAYNSNNNTATPCEVGTYSHGWGREPCDACGTGYTTDGTGTVNSDACKLPPGYGTARSIATGLLSGAPCPVGTYGRSVATYGLVDVECTKCLEFTTTTTTGSTGPADCLTLSGYGYYDGGAQMCDYAFWSAGGAQDPCTYCGEGYNTSTGAAGTSPVMGANGADDCVIAAGWTSDGAGSVKPCIQGFYKSLLGASSCLRCPDGTTTTITMAAAERSDCDACRPGFGNVAIDLSAPACTICTSGTYSFGYAPGGEACLECPKPVGFSGTMVSRLGNNDPDQCYPEFLTDGASNSLQYDYIPMDASVFTVTNNIDIIACQALCKSTAGCQYFEHRTLSAESTTCSIRNKGVAAVNINVAGTYVVFEISEGVYATYAGDSTDWASLGNNLVIYATWQEAKTACDKTAACIGFKSNGSQWRTFGGSLAEGVVSKVRVAGEAINPWIAVPSANP